MVDKSVLKAMSEEGNYSWIKIKRYREEDPKNHDVDWKLAYSELLKHHEKETDFLLRKIRELSQELLRDKK